MQVPFVLLPPQIPDDPDPYPTAKGELDQTGATTTVIPSSTDSNPGRSGDCEELGVSGDCLPSASGVGCRIQPQSSIEASISQIEETEDQ